MQVKIWKAAENRKRSPFLAGPIHISCGGGGVGVVPEKQGFSTTLLPPRQPLSPSPAPPDPHLPGRYRIRAAAVDQSLSYVRDAEGDVKSQGQGFTLCPWGASTSEKPSASQTSHPCVCPTGWEAAFWRSRVPPRPFLLCLTLSALLQPLLHSGPVTLPFKAKFLEMMASRPHLLIHTVENLVSTSASHLPKVTNALLKANRRVRSESSSLASWEPPLWRHGRLRSDGRLPPPSHELKAKGPPDSRPQLRLPVLCICSGKVTLTCGLCVTGSVRDQCSKLSEESLPPSDRLAAPTPCHSQ